MSFIRPELAREARRWREALVGAGLCLLALWAWVGGLGLVQWLALPLVVAGAVLVWLGVQRGRFRGPGDGPGVVQVDEAQLSYFGPLSGGVVALDMLVEITLDPTGLPQHWVLHQPKTAPLHIPVTAHGADALVDAFSQLPGFRLEPVLRSLEHPGDRPRQVWLRPGTRRSTTPLRLLH